MKGKFIAYFFWCFGCAGICGAHRFYAGRPVTGFLWLITLGCFGIGQLLDLLLIPEMIEDYNLRKIPAVRHDINVFYR